MKTFTVHDLYYCGYNYQDTARTLHISINQDQVMVWNNAAEVVNFINWLLDKYVLDSSDTGRAIENFIHEQPSKSKTFKEWNALLETTLLLDHKMTA